VKAQIPAGRRMKAGGVLFADTPEDAGRAAGRLLGQTILGFAVDEVLVEERLSLGQELFLGLDVRQ